MRTSLALCVALLAGCDDGADDDYVPQIPQPGAVDTREPASDIADENERPLVRPDTAAMFGDDVQVDTAFTLGRQSRARYERMRLALARPLADACVVVNPGPGVDDGKVGICHAHDGGYVYVRVSPEACRGHAQHARDFRSDDPLCHVLPLHAVSRERVVATVR